MPFLATSEETLFVEWGYVSRAIMDAFSPRSDTVNAASFLGQLLEVLV